jgi:FHS family L-fucose permease-like MFS transporter
VQSLGEETKLGSALVIMAIVGVAIFPLLMGRVSDVRNIQTVYVVPVACFVVVLYFGLRGYKVKRMTNIE